MTAHPSDQAVAQLIRNARVGAAASGFPTRTRTVGEARRPPNYRGQTSIGGTYWFTRADRRLPYSSGLERLRVCLGVS